jgi:iron-sulfur cluster assembly accessory protein
MVLEARMLQEIGTDTLTLSPAAASAVNTIIAEKQLEGYALRVFVAGGGCCSVQFGMALDNKPRENDLTFESNGVKILVDDASIQYLRGGKIDFINDPQHGQGFVVDSPSAKKESGSCACGGGHEHEAHAEEGSSCACGGSCACNN